MSCNPHDENRLIELLSQVWDDDLPPNESFDEINDLVEKLGPAGGEILLQMSAMHVGIRTYVASTNVHQKAMEGLRQAERTPLTTSNSVLPDPATTPAAPTHRVATWMLFALAASLLIGLTYSFVIYQEQANVGFVPSIENTQTIAVLYRPSQPIATLIRSNGANWGAGHNFQPGENLIEGQRLVLNSGIAQVSMACGVDLVLRAPCFVTLTSDKHATLEQGAMVVHAAKWATGFIVEADDLQITDLGTRFAITVEEGGIIEAHVLEGNVLAEPMKMRRPRQSSMLLSSGEAIHVDRAKAQVDLIEARNSDFNDMVAPFRPLKPILLWNTGIGKKVGDQDDHWRVVAGVPEDGPYPRPVSVIDGVKGPYRDNHPESSQWISVSSSSWPGAAPDSVYTYETSFDLSGFDLSSVYIVGHFLVDDTIREIRINGKSVEFKNWETTWENHDFQSFHPIEITEGFLPGENVISLDVYNNPTRPPEGSSKVNPNPNPTGLRVEWQAFGGSLP